MLRREDDPEKKPVILSIISVNVKDKIPLTYRLDMKKGIQKLYCWSIITGYKKASKIKHVWYFNYKKTAEVELLVKPGYYRTWSSKNIQNDKKGLWEVVVFDEAGNEVGIGNTSFRVSEKRIKK